MSDLHGQFEEMADASGPPTRLTADAVYAEAWRRRRQATTSWTVGGVGAVALVAVLGIGTLGAPSAGPATPHPSASPAPAEPLDRDGAILAALAADASHFYAVINACTADNNGRHCNTELASTDGATAYAIVTPATVLPDSAATSLAVRRPRVFHTADGGGSWEQGDPGKTLPIGIYWDTPVYIAADGSHVVGDRSAGEPALVRQHRQGHELPQHFPARPQRRRVSAGRRVRRLPRLRRHCPLPLHRRAALDPDHGPPAALTRCVTTGRRTPAARRDTSDEPKLLRQRGG